ncbi:MAG: hypothetical protein LBJ35_07740 [Spirochaetaceae bacterium]|nr:hypothetical protein [Spirochaetaceae bacterium]
MKNSAAGRDINFTNHSLNAAFGAVSDVVCAERKLRKINELQTLRVCNSFIPPPPQHL